MTLTYTEIEKQKNTRIWVFFIVVVLFYFLIAVILANVTKAFFVLQAADLFGRGSPFLTRHELLNVLLFALVAATLHAFYSIHHVSSFVTQNLGAIAVDPADTYHQRFKTIVEEVNVATGNKYIIAPVVIPTLAMNAFALSHDDKHALMGVTEGLLSKLNRQQLQAVIAHEVGHIVSGDSYQTTLGCSFFGIYAAMLSGMRKIFRGGRVRISGRAGGIVLFLALIYILLTLLQFFYNLIRLFVSRDRELRADAIAVKITRDPISLSEALVLISRGWRGFGDIDSNLESLFIMNPLREEVDESEGFWADLLSTHPPIRKRIALLTQMAHVDAQAIEEHVLSQEKIKEKTRESAFEKKGSQWMVMEKEKGWAGPFTFPQLMHLGWVTPDTWLKGIEEESVKQAKDEPLLKPFFEGQLKGFQASALLCPTCKQSLVEETYEGAIVKRCLFCEGVLLEENKMPRLVIRREVRFDERIERLAELAQKSGLQKFRLRPPGNARSSLQCPRCGAWMVKGFYTMAYLVEVDRCFSCNLIWFEKDELELVQYLIEHTKGL